MPMLIVSLQFDSSLIERIFLACVPVLVLCVHALMYACVCIFIAQVND